MKLLQISCSTLLRWRKEGILKATKLPSGQYDWDANSVFKILNKGEVRGIYMLEYLHLNKNKILKTKSKTYKALR